ncbi:MAG: MFS transporter [Butyrivibrio sp.]|nr:MFS transporter [Butyrivibrio sp.]
MDSNITNINKENVFKNKNFTLAFLGALVSELGFVLYNFAVGFYILAITGNNAFIQGVYLAISGLSMLIATPFGGVFSDRYNKAKIMYICDYLRGATIIIATVLMLIFKGANAHVAILFVLGMMGNLISGIFVPSAESLLPLIVKEELLQQANSYNAMKTAFEGIVGIILAGILYSMLNIHTLFFIVGLCYIASGISEMFIRYKNETENEKITLAIAFKDMKAGFDYIKIKKGIPVLLGAMLFINFFFTPFMNNFIPYFIRTDVANASSYLFDSFLKPELWSSIFSLCFGISSFVGAAVLSSRFQEKKCGKKVAYRIFTIAVIMLAITAAYIALVKYGIALNAFLILLCIVGLLLGTLIACINIPTMTVLMQIVDKNMMGKVSSIISIGGQGMVPIASVLAGLILKYMGNASLLIFCSVGFTLTALFMVRSKDINEF